MEQNLRMARLIVRSFESAGLLRQKQVSASSVAGAKRHSGPVDSGSGRALISSLPYFRSQSEGS